MHYTYVSTDKHATCQNILVSCHELARHNAFVYLRTHRVKVLEEKEEVECRGGRVDEVGSN